MNRRHMKHNRRPYVRSATDRTGSALMIVVVLLGLLAFIGVVFYTFSAQERENADYFAQSAKEAPQTEDLFDFALEQLIVGPPEYIPQSALWGRRKSIVANMVGRLDPRTGRPSDLNSFSGRGVNLTLDSNNVPAVDRDYDGNADTNDPYSLLQFNDSPAAWGSPTVPAFTFSGLRRGFYGLPEPDVDYTYPDINNLFLAFNGYGLDSTGNPVAVIIPSFHRPQYLRYYDGSGPASFQTWQRNNGDTDGDGTSEPGEEQTVTRILRPHPDHVVFDARGRVARYADGTPVRRFLDTGDSDLASLTAGSGPFPFDVHYDDDDSDGTIGSSNDIPNEQGVWGSNASLQWEYDVDNDGVGETEGIWLDLGYPMQEDPVTGAKYVPLASFTVYDADGLLNLNIHGNLNGDLDFAVNPFGGTMGGTVQLLSRSNQGLSPGEVNPEWALSGDPTSVSSTVFEQHNRFFGHDPADRREAANMEWWFVNMGRGQLKASRPNTSNANQSLLAASDIDDLFAGRWGDMNYLYGGLVGGSSDPNQDGFNSDPYDYPRPGRWNEDDNTNQNEGGARGLFPAFGHPLDFSGTGRFVRSGTHGRTPNLFQALGASNPNVWLRYTNYGLAGLPAWSLGPDGAPGVAGVDDDGANGADDWAEIGWAGSDDLLAEPRFNVLLDDPMELTVEPKRAERPHDEPFTADELAFLHLSNTDLSNTGVTGRLEELVPFNFAADPSSNPNGERIRRRFTTSSWDRKGPAFPRLIMGPGPDGQPGRKDVDDDEDGNTDDTSELGWPGTDDHLVPGRFDPTTQTLVPFREWEFSADADLIVDQQDGHIELSPDGKLEFPPRFGTVPEFAKYEDMNGNGTLDSDEDMNGNGTLDVGDPFRPVLRRLLTMELGETGDFPKAERLAINGVLDVQRRPDVVANEYTDRLVFRTPTPHPGSTLDSLSVSAWRQTNYPTSMPAYPPADDNPQAQEWWARYDRQCMARDIYVLLYTLAGLDPEDRNGNGTLDAGEDQNGNGVLDNFNYASDSNARSGGARPLHTDAQLREMAQFAVNLVDNLDRDNVITKFEYDKDLSNGWNLDDDPFSWTGESQPLVRGASAYDASYPEDGDERGVIYGMEAQQLAFNEALVIKADRVVDDAMASPPTMADHEGTEYDDTKDRYFTYIELRNASPFDVDFNNGAFAANSVFSGVWQIEAIPVQDAVNSETFDNAVKRRRRLTLRNGSITSGGLFTILSTGDGNTSVDSSGDRRPSYFRVDPNWSTTTGTPSYVQIVPKTVGVNPQLDLIPTPNTTSDLSNESDFRLAKSPDPGSTSPAQELWLFGDGVRVNAIGEFVKGGIVGAEDVNGNNAIDAGEDVDGSGSLEDRPTSELTFVLRRRLHPWRRPPVEQDTTGANASTHAEQSQDNPWIEVDRIGLQIDFTDSSPDVTGNDPDITSYSGDQSVVRSFTITKDEEGTSYQGDLTALTSRERYQPLRRTTATGSPQGGGDDQWKANSLGRENVVTPNPFTLWQPHFDRSFSSAGELLSVPLTELRTLNRWFSRSQENPGEQFRASERALTAEAKFLAPQYVYGQDGKPGVANVDDDGVNGTDDPGEYLYTGSDDLNLAVVNNRWYRLFDFVEVPTRTHRQLGDPLALTRVPGKINLNTMRHPEVLAALLDDDDVITIDSDVDQNNGNDEFLADTLEGVTNRDWWRKLIEARDGVRLLSTPSDTFLDPVTSAILPGVAGSRPFHGLNFLPPAGNEEQTRNLLDHTSMRLFPVSSGATATRLLFELGTENQHTGVSTPPVDYYTRHRLLSKIWSNVTTRSNVFYAFITIRSFEAVEVTPDPAKPDVKVVRVGGELKDAAGDYIVNQRGFFVIDRSDIEEAYDSNTRTFNWRTLVKYRLRIE